MTAILANIPWWLTAGLILIGAVLLTHGNRAGKSNLRSVGLAVISLAFLLGVARFLIDTPAEKCEKRTRQIVESANRQDWGQLQKLMDSDTVVDLAGKEPGAKGAEIGKTAELLAKKVELKNVDVYELRTQQPAADQITVNFVAASKFNDGGTQWFSSAWEFDYMPTGGSWHLRTIKLLQLQNQNL